MARFQMETFAYKPVQRRCAAVDPTREPCFSIAEVAAVDACAEPSDEFGLEGVREINPLALAARGHWAVLSRCAPGVERGEESVADTYIDLFETIIYGELACTEMRTRVMPLHPAWASAVERCIELQEAANANVKAIIAQLPGFKVDEAEIASVTDTIVRFGAWLHSLKGRPLDPARFFGSAPPSDVARQRFSKLTGHLERMIHELAPHAEGGGGTFIEGANGRLAELREAHAVALRIREAQRAALEARKTLGPLANAARAAWLRTYVANKRLIEGILRHHNREALMPLIFDDLAETQRSKVDSDEDTDLDRLVTGSAGDDSPADSAPPIEPPDDPSSR